jgi:hypothetical protein
MVSTAIIVTTIVIDAEAKIEPDFPKSYEKALRKTTLTG